MGHYAFTGTIPLQGLLPDGNSPDPLEYRFQFAEYDPAGNVLGAISSVDPTVISGIMASTIIGSLEYWDWNGIVWKLKAAAYYANNPGVAPTTIHRPLALGGDLIVTLNVNVQPGGWIQVPRQNDLKFGGVGRFVGGNVNLLDLDTTKLTNEFYDLTTPDPALKAGESVPAAKRSIKHRFKLFFEARLILGGTGVSTNNLEKIAISNISYKQLRHPNWAGNTPTLKAVVMLDITELAGGGAGCMKLTTDLHALYTVYHPFMGDVSVYFEGNPPLPAASSLVPVAGEVVSGLISDVMMSDHIGFCKA